MAPCRHRGRALIFRIGEIPPWRPDSEISQPWLFLEPNKGRCQLRRIEGLLRHARVLFKEHSGMSGPQLCGCRRLARITRGLVAMGLQSPDSRVGRLHHWVLGASRSARPVRLQGFLTIDNSLTALIAFAVVLSDGALSSRGPAGAAAGRGSR